jgi:hypothetical protein
MLYPVSEGCFHCRRGGGTSVCPLCSVRTPSSFRKWLKTSQGIVAHCLLNRDRDR